MPTQSKPTFESSFLSIYHELRAEARRLDCGDQQPTAIVHEAYLRLRASQPKQIRGTTHFRHLARRVMRRALIDQVRHQERAKRGGRHEHQSYVMDGIEGTQSNSPSLEIIEILERLSTLNPRHSMIAILKLIGGLTMDEIAQELSFSRRLIADDWAFVRGWLRLQIADSHDD